MRDLEDYQRMLILLNESLIWNTDIYKVSKYDL